MVVSLLLVINAGYYSLSWFILQLSFFVSVFVLFVCVLLLLAVWSQCRPPLTVQSSKSD